MKNGIASNRAPGCKAKALFLAAVIFSTAGCNTGNTPPQLRKEAGDARDSTLFNVRYQVDSARGRIWWVTADGVYLHDASAPEKIMLSLPNWQWVGAPYSCLPDLALGPKGEAVITSNIVPTLWRIDPETLAVSVHPLVLDADTDKDVGFSGLAYSAEHAAFFAVSDVHGSLWRIDPLLRRAQKVSLSTPIRKACGLAVQSGIARQTASRRAGLCLRAPQEDWIVDLAPDQRSGYVKRAACTDRPWLLSQLSLKND